MLLDVNWIVNFHYSQKAVTEPQNPPQRKHPNWPLFRNNKRFQHVQFGFCVL